jgi:hypothetical protein
LAPVPVWERAPDPVVTELYANGLQAFQDYQPIQQHGWSGTGDDRIDGAPDLYRTQSYGADARGVAQRASIATFSP